MIENDPESFSVQVSGDEIVEDLKKTIINQGLPGCNDLSPKHLKLWQVDKPDNQKIDSSGLTDENALKPTWKISDYWKGALPEKCIHIYIKILGKLIAVDPPILLQKISLEFALHVR